MLKLALLGIVVALPSFASAQRVTVDSKNHTVTMAEAGLRIRLNQTMGCFLDRVEVRGREVLSSERTACTGIKVGERWITSRSRCYRTPGAAIGGLSLRVEVFGGSSPETSNPEAYELPLTSLHINTPIRLESDPDHS